MSERKEIVPFKMCSRTCESPLGRDYKALCAAVAACQPLVFVDTYDHETFDRMLLALRQENPQELGGREDLKSRQIVEYRPGCGGISFETKDWCEQWSTDAAALPFRSWSCGQLAFFLKEYLDVSSKYQKRMLVLREISAELVEEPMFVQWLRAIVGNNLAQDAAPMPVFIVAAGVSIPESLQPFSALIRLSKPSPEEILSIALAWSKANLAEGSRRKRNFDRRIGSVVPYLSGRCESEIVQVLNYIKDDGVEAGLVKIRESKRDMVRKSGFLELKEPQRTDFAGLDELRKYLKNVKRTIDLIRDGVGQKNIQYGFEENGKNRLQMPKGILMVGMPGCGKSLIAKVAAHESYLNRPLIQLDVGRLLGKYVGQSEERLNRALDIAEAAAPCILWIDELEKAFSGLDSSDGTSKRLLGRFLTWLQDKTADVYVIATANSLKKIPPELKRRGRFDEIFRLMLPTRSERERLFRFCCQKIYHIDSLKDADYATLARESAWKGGGKGDEAFSASDIEAMVASAVQRAILSAEEKYGAEPTDVTDDELSVWRTKRCEALNRVQPSLSDFRAEINDMRGKSQRDRIEDYEKCRDELVKSGFVLASK